MKKVLIVDDQPDIRRLLRLTLNEKFAVTEAVEADDAHALILLERPDAILLDVMMPGSMNGFQLCEKIKRDPDLSAIHVVLMTARTQVADQELGRAVGADEYFIKPFSPLAMMRHLSVVLPHPAGNAKTTPST